VIPPAFPIWIKFGEPGAVKRDIQISLENYQDYIVKKQEF
jgi:hypothetical protein